MTLRRTFAFATSAGMVLLAGCSLATSFSGLAESTGDAGSAASGDGGPGAGLDGSVASKDGGSTMVDGATPSDSWGAVTIVQSRRSTGKFSVDLDQATTKGTLLVVLCPDPKPPTPQGMPAKWQMLKSSYGGTVVIWPNHPGGITHFSINDANNDLFFMEMSGVPADVQLSAVVDTGPKDGGTTTEALSTPIATGPHGIAFLYLDTSQATTASADMGWTSLGTDGNNDYGWFRLDPVAPFSATVTISPVSPAALMMVQVGNGK